MIQKLDEAAITAALPGVPGWDRRGDGLERRYTFADFTEAFAFMTRVALLAGRWGGATRGADRAWAAAPGQLGQPGPPGQPDPPPR